MNDVQLASLAWLRDRVASASEIAGAWGSRLATWLIVGNAIALFTVVSARDLEGNILQLATPFLAGLCITFVAGALNYLISLSAIKYMAETADSLSTMMSCEIDLKAFEKDNPAYRRSPEMPLEKCISDAEVKMTSAKNNLAGLGKWVLLSVSMFMAGALCFAYGAYNGARILT